MSNLVNEEEISLDFMDPYQRNSRSIIWEKVMKGDFKLPSGKTFYPNDPASVDDEGDYLDFSFYNYLFAWITIIIIIIINVLSLSYNYFYPTAIIIMTII